MCSLANGEYFSVRCRVAVRRDTIHARTHNLPIPHNDRSKRSPAISDIIGGEIYRQTHKFFYRVLLHGLSF